MAEQSHTTNPSFAPFPLNGTIAMGRDPDDPDILIFVVDTEDLEPDVSRGDLVFVDTQSKWGEGLFLMGSGALARCQAGSRHELYHVDHGGDSPVWEGPVEIFNKSIEGRVTYHMKWLVEPTEDLLEQVLANATARLSAGGRAVMVRRGLLPIRIFG